MIVTVPLGLLIASALAIALLCGLVGFVAGALFGARP